MPTGWPTLVIEVAFATDPLAAIPTWTDISGYAQGFTTSRGRSFELDAVEAGTASILLRNGDGRFDPLNTAGPYYPNLTVNRRIRISATWNATTYALYDGFVDSWPQTIANDEKVNRLTQVQLPCTDAFKFLSKNNLEPVGAFTVGDADYGVVGTARVGGQLVFQVDSELCGDRVNRILDLWPFPTQMRFVDDGLTLLSKDGTPKTGRHLDPNETSLSYLRKIRDSEEGRFHISTLGEIVFWQRDSGIGETSAITLTDDGTGDAGYSGIVVDPADDRYIRNVIERTEHWRDIPWTIQSAGSVATYGPIKDSREVVIRFPADAVAQITWLLAKYKDPKVRISQITIQPRRNPTVLWPAVLGLELGDQITVSREIPGTPGSGAPADYWIEKIQHQVTALLEWETVWQLAPVDASVY